MISFYPGPSKVWDALPQYMQAACDEGILSVNHRSPEFVGVARECLRLLHEKLNIPRTYTIMFNSSATESWEIISQSVLGNEKSLHLFNGAFGEKWYEYTLKLTRAASAQSFSPETLPDPLQFKLTPGTLMLALTHCETSNGTALPDEFLLRVRSAYPDQLIAVDATSSMGGMDLPFETADIWFASVQKCFGLPAGLGLIICSPKAIERAHQLAENDHYNSLDFMAKMISEGQTTYTPNVLGIYLLMKSLQDRPSIAITSRLLQERFQNWLQFFSEEKTFSLLIKNPGLQSPTVIPVEGEKKDIENIKKTAKAAGFYLGNGYGEWKQTTFRIANFPAHTSEEINRLMNFLKTRKL